MIPNAPQLCGALKEAQPHMQAVILAGGNATRLYPVTSGVPKPMLPLFDRPVMEHQIKLLADHGIRDIIATVSRAAVEIPGYFGDGSRWGVRIRYSVEDEPMGAAGGLKMIQDAIEGTFLVVSGDTVTDADLTSAVALHRSSRAVATLLLYEMDDPTDCGLVRHGADGRVTGFLEKPRSTEVFTNTISAGIYVFEPDVLSCIPHQQYYDLGRQLVTSVLNNGDPVYGFRIPGYWCDVGNVHQYRNAHFAALEGRLKLDLPAEHVGDGVWIGEGADIHPLAEILAPAFVGRNACVRRNATVGGRAVLGEGVVVSDGALVARSVIGRGSLVGSKTWVTDSILGGHQAIVEGEAVSDRVLIAPDQWSTLRHQAPEQIPSERNEPVPDRTSEVHRPAA